MSSSTPALPTGAPVRDTAGRALLGAAVLATAFTVFAAVTTQDRAIRAHSPWQDDPYDALVSSTQLLVPVMLLAGVARAQLCRRSEPLPLARLEGLLRAARLVVLLVAATVGVDVLAVLVGADRPAWSGVTPVLSGAALALFVASAAVWSRLRAVRVPAVPGPDWVGDLGALVRFVARPLGSAGRPLRVAATWVDRVVDTWVRPRPVTAAAALALGAGGLESVVIGWREKGFGPLLVFVAVVEVSSLFAVLVAANGYLRVVRIDHPLVGARRLLLVCVTAACFGLSLAVAFRDLLWRLLGLGGSVDTLGRIWAVSLAGAGVGAALAALARTLRRLVVRRQGD